MKTYLNSKVCGLRKGKMLKDFYDLQESTFVYGNEGKISTKIEE